jgi:shikimate dehydrogenase
MGDFDIVINSTSLGMKSDDPIPLHPEWLNSKMIVMDLVYCPLETEFLKSSKKVGCKTVNGIGMLLYQGASAFEIWTGVKPDIEIMKSVLEKTICP